MSKQLIGGWLDGHSVRTARKPHFCDYWRGREGRCVDKIEIGHRYCEGECNPDNAGGFGQYRYCFACAGYDPETLHAKERETV